MFSENLKLGTELALYKTKDLQVLSVSANG